MRRMACRTRTTYHRNTRKIARSATYTRRRSGRFQSSAYRSPALGRVGDAELALEAAFRPLLNARAIA
jgi:hypothetical protein